MVLKICDKTIIIKGKSKHINSNSHQHKQKYIVVVKEYEFIRPYNNRFDNIIQNSAKDCYNICFHTFILKWINDIEMTNGDFDNGIISEKTFKKIIRESIFLHKLTKKIIRVCQIKTYVIIFIFEDQ